jgi:hypothetical protein
VQREVRTFGAMTADLLTLSDCPTEFEITQIAIESTGVFWRPVYDLLEDEGRTLVLVNLQHSTLQWMPSRRVRPRIIPSSKVIDTLHKSLRIYPGVAISPGDFFFGEMFSYRCWEVSAKTNNIILVKDNTTAREELLRFLLI